MSFYSKLSQYNQESWDTAYTDPAKIDQMLGKSYFFGGNSRIGKTRSALHYAKKMIENYHVSEEEQLRMMGFVSFSDFCKIARNSIGDNHEQWENRKIIQDIKTLDFLIIDDLGTEKQTEYIDQEFLDLLKNRIENIHFITIFTSNSSLAQIKEKYHERIATRITELCGEENIFYVPNGVKWAGEKPKARNVDLTEIFSKNRATLDPQAYKAPKNEPINSAVQFLKSIKKVNENMYQRIKQGTDEQGLRVLAKFAKTANQNELNHIFNLTETF